MNYWDDRIARVVPYAAAAVAVLLAVYVFSGCYQPLPG